MEVDELKAVRLEKLEKLKSHDLNPYGGKYITTGSVGETLDSFEEGKEVVLAGRMVAFRSHGKVAFADIQDQTGRMQLFIRAKEVLGNGLEMVKALDIGDIIGVKGELFITKTEQRSVRVSELRVLSKSLMSLPEKFHGLKDVEVRYRQRYVDLIANPEVRDVFINRSKIVSMIRRYLDDRKFLEVETPMLQTLAGGARGRPFKKFTQCLWFRCVYANCSGIVFEAVTRRWYGTCL